MAGVMLTRWAVLAALLMVPALQGRGLIEQALDEPTEIKLDNVRLGDALRSISEQTGVRVHMADDAMRLVPHGAETIIRSVNIANVPLRSGLHELFSPLGMSLVVLDDRVEVVPRPALRCLGRAATWEELDTLSMLSGMQPGLDARALASLRPRFQFRVDLPDAWRLLSEAVANVGAGTGDEVLTIACDNFGWTWCPTGEQIVVTTREEQLRNALHRVISLRMNNRPLMDVLQAIGRRADVPVRLEPGALMGLPVAVQQNFALNVHEQPTVQVLDTIAAYTGLGYLVDPGGVLFYRADVPVEDSTETPRTTTGGGAADPYVAKMIVMVGDNQSFEWLIRRSELPEDLRKMRERDLAEMIEALRNRTAN